MKITWNSVARQTLFALGLLAVVGLAQAAQRFETAKGAADALVDAIATSDGSRLKLILGSDYRRFVSEDRVDRDDIYAFLAAWAKIHKVEMNTPSNATLVVGEGGFRFPIPIARDSGGWSFDLRAGVLEMHRRRIKRNELGAVRALQTLCEAQIRYRATVGQGQSAMYLISRPGKRDGLYWPSNAQALNDRSPLSDDALAMSSDAPIDAALHGYRYAPLRGEENDTCAFVAWPATYGKSGENSWIIKGQSSIFQRDYGRRTGAADYKNLNDSRTMAHWMQIPQ